MTIDKTLRVKRGAVSNRSVLSRAERIAQLKVADRWNDGDSPIGLPKVRVRKLQLKKKKKEKKEGEEGAAAEGAAAPAAAAPAKKAESKGGKKDKK
jgi:small basic protein (TIGR04137 family)